MSVFDFDHAIVREPARSVINGIRSNPEAEVHFSGILREHSSYVAALRAAGARVEVLPALERYPDSVFVEDPALVLPKGAILLRPGAPARLGESAEIRGALNRHFDQILELEGEEFVDGGDVLVMPDVILVGRSRRTNDRGAEALRSKLDRLGRKSRIVATPDSILHLKTAVSLLSEDTVLATRQMADTGIFSGFRIVVVPEGEEHAANALRVNETIFVGDCFPRTIDLVAQAGFAVHALPVMEIGKLDAGLSCMSLRWMKQR
ncbi:MAG TPA: arginine deiminase family protein [Rhizomicrobium sp.]|jgi:dimethylargininase